MTAVRSPVPFGVELLQLYEQVGDRRGLVEAVTSAFRRGASSAELENEGTSNSTTIVTSAFRRGASSAVGSGVEAGHAHVAWSPVPFGVELLQL